MCGCRSHDGWAWGLVPPGAGERGQGRPDRAAALHCGPLDASSDTSVAAVGAFSASRDGRARMGLEEAALAVLEMATVAPAVARDRAMPVLAAGRRSGDWASVSIAARALGVAC